jgi:N-acetylmuramoyl-L-alanine amidase
MIRRIARWLVMVVLIGGAWTATAAVEVAWAAGRQPQVTGIDLREQGGATTITIDLSRRVDYRVFFLNEPMRAIIDLPPVGWALPGMVPAPRGLVAGYRYGLFDPDTARLVLDLSGPARVGTVHYDLAPASSRQQLIIELVHTTQQDFDDQIQPWTQSVTKTAGAVEGPTATRAESAPGAGRAPRIEPPTISLPSAPPPRPPAAAPPVAPRLAAAIVPLPPVIRPGAQRRPSLMHTVVLDAGHGGVDPGTIGIGGTFEKNITLPMVLEIRRQLLATGRYKVVLTRDRDIFIPLQERVAIARAARADLFISIHADSNHNSQERGATVYTLSNTASDAEAAAEAARENRSDIIAGVDLTHQNKEVTSILIDLAQRESMNRSATFANLLVKEIGPRALIPEKPHRFAGFVVLRDPDVPSALIELGYLSNVADERLLTDPRHRAKVAAAICRAVDRYFDHEVPPS